MALRIVSVIIYLVVAVSCANIKDSLLQHRDRKEFINVLNPCDKFSSSDKWITIQRRLDGTVEFYRKWDDYVNGFGSVYGEFWIGLDNLHMLTSDDKMKMLVVMEDLEGNFRCAAYKSFMVNSPNDTYKLTIAGFSGDAGDSLSWHNGKPFSTYDKDNDLSDQNCAFIFKGGWWYNNCHASNLNGLYLNGTHTAYATGVNWKGWKGHYYSMKSVEMMLAPAA